MTWAQLRPAARLFRIAHATWGVLNLAALAVLWWSAFGRVRGRTVNASITLLTSEGIALVIGRGDCPFGSFQARLGDPVPMFEWVLSPRAAKAAIPVLTVITLASLALVALRPPQGHRSLHGGDAAVRDA